MLRQLENKTNMKIVHLDTRSRKRDAVGTREEGISVGSDDWGSQPAGLLNMSLGQKR